MFMSLTLADAAAQLKRTTPKYGWSNGLCPAVLLMTDRERLPSPIPALASLRRGNGVILRHYGDPSREALARNIKDVCARLRLTFIVAEDWRLAAAVKADGLHLSDSRARTGPPPGARLWLKHKRRLLTTAAHGPVSINRAAVLRADACLLAPVFATKSHPGAHPIGPLRAGLMCRLARVTVLALGGITAHSVRSLRFLGIGGIAGIGFVQEQEKVPRSPS